MSKDRVEIHLLCICANDSESLPFALELPLTVTYKIRSRTFSNASFVLLDSKLIYLNLKQTHEILLPVTRAYTPQLLLEVDIRQNNASCGIAKIDLFQDLPDEEFNIDILNLESRVGYLRLQVKMFYGDLIEQEGGNLIFDFH